MNVAETNLVRFIRTAKYDPSFTKGQDLTRLDVAHYGSKRSEVIYSTSDLGGKEEDLARILMSFAEQDCESIRGSQMYAIHTFYGPEDKQREGLKYRFTLDAASDKGNFADDMNTEPATIAGLLKQMMRHLENREKNQQIMFRDSMHHYHSMLSAAHSRNELLEAREQESIRIREELLSMKDEREVNRMKVENQEKRFDEILSTLKTLMPGAVNQLTGKTVFAGAKSPLQLHVEQIAKSLNHEQMDKLQEILTPEQKIIFLQLVDQGLSSPSNGKA